MNRDNKQAPVALITGAARRIGAAIARVLHQVGFRVMIHYHQSEQEARALADELNRIRPDSAKVIMADLVLPTTATHLISTTIHWAGRLDLLVNNASVFKRTALGAIHETDWDELFTVNVKTPYRLSQAAFPELAKYQGVIINITDIHADNPLNEYAVYCQTKAALVMQTKALAREFAPTVRVNAVAPGAIAWPEEGNSLSQSIKEKIIQHTPLKQHGKPEYIAMAVLALVQNPFITGEVLRVDGGRGLSYS